MVVGTELAGGAGPSGAALYRTETTITNEVSVFRSEERLDENR